jgi:hypothetical protein
MPAQWAIKKRSELPGGTGAASGERACCRPVVRDATFPTPAGDPDSLQKSHKHRRLLRKGNAASQIGARRRPFQAHCGPRPTCKPRSNGGL